MSKSPSRFGRDAFADTELDTLEELVEYLTREPRGWIGRSAPPGRRVVAFLAEQPEAFVRQASPGAATPRVGQRQHLRTTQGGVGPTALPAPAYTTGNCAASSTDRSPCAASSVTSASDKRRPSRMEGLHRLEYRGYDSAGIAIGQGTLKVAKRQGKVRDLRALKPQRFKGMQGIAHTRWATSGARATATPIPIATAAARYAVVHNGIIENATALKGAAHRARHRLQPRRPTPRS